jgi:hypothetical protein
MSEFSIKENTAGGGAGANKKSHDFIGAVHHLLIIC